MCFEGGAAAWGGGSRHRLPWRRPPTAPPCSTPGSFAGYASKGARSADVLGPRWPSRPPSGPLFSHPAAGYARRLFGLPIQRHRLQGLQHRRPDVAGHRYAPSRAPSISRPSIGRSVVLPWWPLIRRTFRAHSPRSIFRAAQGRAREQLESPCHRQAPKPAHDSHRGDACVLRPRTAPGPLQHQP